MLERSAEVLALYSSFHSSLAKAIDLVLINLMETDKLRDCDLYNLNKEIRLIVDVKYGSFLVLEEVVNIQGGTRNGIRVRIIFTEIFKKKILVGERGARSNRQHKNRP